MTAKVAKNSGRGSKPGERRGGRKPGTPNRRTAELQEHVAATGDTPLDYLLRVMRDTGADEAKRIDCAKAAAPYVHARLNAVDLKADVDGRFEFSWLE
jgi:hypothetical protein